MGTEVPIETAEAVDTGRASQNEFPWSVVVMIGVLIGLAVVLAVTARRRLRQGSDAGGWQSC